MSEKTAIELFTEKPRTYNCPQCVVIGCGRPDLAESMAFMHCGRAPEGRCGALFAALSLVPESRHEQVRREFAAATGSEFCLTIKQEFRTSCQVCVAKAADLVNN